MCIGNGALNYYYNEFHQEEIDLDEMLVVDGLLESYLKMQGLIVTTYNKQQLTELSELYNININTLLSQQKKGKQAVDFVIIKKIVKDKKVTLEQFLKLFEEKTLTDRIIEVGQKPYSSLSSLELEMLSIENENGYFIDETLYENRKLIEEIRKKWWEED